MAAVYVVACFCAIIASGAGHETIYAEKGHVLTIKPPPISKFNDLIWKINGNKVVEYDGHHEQVYRSFKNRTVLDKSSGELHIKNLLFEDSGNYVLEVVLPNNTITTNLYPVKVIEKVSKITITCEGEGGHQAKLVCTAESTPRHFIEFEWSYAGTKQPGSNLTVPLGGKDDDTVYTCHVKNPLNEEEVSFTAKHCKPEKAQIVWPIIISLFLLILCIILGVIFRQKIKAKWENCRASCCTTEADPPTSINASGDAHVTTEELQPFNQKGELDENRNAGQELETVEVVKNGDAHSQSIDLPAV
ncbi:SLAM family member 9-like [Synchiropus splendidus]|uniref:SLAM family member 9-like n=1 Tax=Synchiropus splendidus TaxID=270530 RepID=UPI00237DF6BD|nr:SLAM family member 9-like [Synchiropus splendidus]